jgi:hypothetical protein
MIKDFVVPHQNQQVLLVAKTFRTQSLDCCGKLSKICFIVGDLITFSPDL